MRLASYHGNRAGVMALGNILIRWRLRGAFSHTEVMFEPGDGEDVADLMPDGSLEPDADGAYWMASSVGLERMPVWSKRRPGRLGGLRLKRIVPDPRKWTLVPIAADPLASARLARECEGSLYDWQLIASFLLWVIPHKMSRGHCAEWSARLAGVPQKDAWRFDPCSLPVALALNVRQP